MPNTFHCQDGGTVELERADDVGLGLELQALHHEVAWRLFWLCWTTTPPIDERVTGWMRLWMTFWKSAEVEAAALPVAVLPTSSCWLVSGCRLGLPKIVVPIGVTVKFAPSSVAVGARKPLEAPTRVFSQSVTRKVAPAE